MIFLCVCVCCCSPRQYGTSAESFPKRSWGAMKKRNNQTCQTSHISEKVFQLCKCVVLFLNTRFLFMGRHGDSWFANPSRSSGISVHLSLYVPHSKEMDQFHLGVDSPFVARGLDSGWVLSEEYFEGPGNVDYSTSCSTLHCRKVSFLQCCSVKR